MSTLYADLSLSAILLVKLIHHRLRRLKNLHTPRRIRMAADRDRIILYRQMHRTPIHRRDRLGPDLLLHMLLHILEFPRPGHHPRNQLSTVDNCGLQEIRNRRMNGSTHFFFRSITNIPSALYLTSPYISAQNSTPKSRAAFSICVPASPNTGVPGGIPRITASATS